MGILGVRDLGHINQLTDDYLRGVEHMRRLFGARFFSPIWTPEWEANNGLFLIGDTCLELMAPYSSTSVLGKSLERQGPGFYGFEFRVHDYHAAKEAVLERNIGIVSDREPRFFWTHPRDTHGILLAIFAGDFVNDPRDNPNRVGVLTDQGHGLGISRLSHVTLFVHHANAAAEFFADLCGGDVMDIRDLPTVNGRAATAEICGTRYRFVEPSGEGPIQRQLLNRGTGVHVVTFVVPHLDRVHEWSSATMVPVRPGIDESSLVVSPRVNLGAAYEFTTTS